jgi:hypothetical protein
MYVIANRTAPPTWKRRLQFAARGALSWQPVAVEATTTGVVWLAYGGAAWVLHANKDLAPGWVITFWPHMLVIVGILSAVNFIVAASKSLLPALLAIALIVSLPMQGLAYAAPVAQLAAIVGGCLYAVCYTRRLRYQFARRPA